MRAAFSIMLLTIVCCLGSDVEAQGIFYRFDHWTAETGLPQNIITDIHQTPEGYLWVATMDGLARFDGVRFTVFNKSNTPGLRSNRFTCLYQDAQGDLWAGTEVGVVTRYCQGQFITYGIEHGLPTSAVLALTGDQQGRPWALSGHKVRAWEPTAEKFIERDAPPFSDGSGGLWWNAEGGFWGLDQAEIRLFARGEWTHLALPAWVGGTIAHVAKAGDGDIWIATSDGRIFRHKDGKVTAFPLRNQKPREARPLTEWRDRAGKIWEMEIVQNLLRKLTIPSSGQSETITLRTLYEDRDGNLWLGTDGQGLYSIRKQIVTTFSREQGLIGRNVYPVYEGRAGAIWVGAWDGGLSQIKAEKITNFTTRDGLSAGAVTALCEDRAGRLWVATGADLQIFEQGRFTSVKAQYRASQTTVNAIYQDRMGAMWFGANHGLFRYHNGQEQHFTTRDGLPGEAVRVIIEAAAGGVWVGCYGGLMRWREDKLTTWTERDGLPGNTVRSLYEDQDGALWIGTYDSGLGRFKDGRFTRYTTREGLFNDGVFQILEDAYGYLWMSSNRGVYRVRKQELNDFAAGGRPDITSIAFGKNDGMRNVECNGGLWPAGARARDGRLWFPTQDGVAVINPAAVTINQQPPPVLIESLKIDNQAIGMGTWESGLTIRPGQENFEIEYTALSFINSEHIQFKYKLEGLDHDWVDAGARRTAYFSHVPPGEYTFQVIAANSDGVWNTKGQSLRITVALPFWRTWWFLTLASLSVAGVVIAAFKYRVRQIEQREAAQQAFAQQLIESQEAERKRIAAELHDGLGQNLIVIKNWAALGLNFTEPAAPVREQLQEIATTAMQSLKEVREIINNLRPHQLETIGLSQTLKFMCEQAVTAAGLELRLEIASLDGALPPADEVTFFRLVQEGLNNILKHANATRAAIVIERGEGVVRLTMEDDGCGFDPVALQYHARGGFGLKGLAERVRQLGGAFRLQSAPGQGTKIQITLQEIPHGK